MAQREYKHLSWRDAGADCDFLVRSEKEDEVAESLDCPVVADLYPGLPARAAAAAAANSSSI